jgi:hypothetical protein
MAGDSAGRGRQTHGPFIEPAVDGTFEPSSAKMEIHGGRSRQPRTGASYDVHVTVFNLRSPMT